MEKKKEKKKEKENNNNEEEEEEETKREFVCNPKSLQTVLDYCQVWDEFLLESTADLTLVIGKTDAAPGGAAYQLLYDNLRLSQELEAVTKSLSKNQLPDRRVLTPKIELLLTTLRNTDTGLEPHTFEGTLKCLHVFGNMADHAWRQCLPLLSPVDIVLTLACAVRDYFGGAPTPPLFDACNTFIKKKKNEKTKRKNEKNKKKVQTEDDDSLPLHTFQGHGMTRHMAYGLVMALMTLATLHPMPAEKTIEGELFMTPLQRVVAVVTFSGIEVVVSFVPVPCLFFTTTPLAHSYCLDGGATSHMIKTADRLEKEQEEERKKRERVKEKKKKKSWKRVQPKRSSSTSSSSVSIT